MSKAAKKTNATSSDKLEDCQLTNKVHCDQERSHGNQIYQDVHYYEILLSLPLESTFTYYSKQLLFENQVVMVEFRGRSVYGIVRKLHSNVKAFGSKQEQVSASRLDSQDQISDSDHSQAQSGRLQDKSKGAAVPKFAFDKNKIKPISKVFDLNLKGEDWQFLKRVSEYNVASIGLVLKQMLASRQAFENFNLINSEKLLKKKQDFTFDLTKLSKPQQEVFDKICQNLSNYSVHLIDGETGSGKTEIYLHAAKNIMENERYDHAQVLILVPEIILTKQLTQRFAERLGAAPIAWHSGLTPAKRRDNYLQIINGQAKFIVGARSALFLPYKNLRLIIVDEEHDKSYKQEEQVIYHGRDMAVLRAKILNIPIIMGSATPSIESQYNVKLGKYIGYFLKGRYSQVALPQVEIVDMGSSREQNIESPFISNTLQSAITSTLARSKQALIFLNRRGYAPFVSCNSCNSRFLCKNCNILMVYHKKRNLCICHHCNYQYRFANKCLNCDSDDLSIIGIGAEKLSDNLAQLYPNANILTLTSDTVGSAKKAEEALEGILNGSIDIIVGTQMIAKGLHFPNLHLVGVIDAEDSMQGLDIRSLERTYQLLHQVSGRAGREEDQGHVIIQTNDSENPMLEYLKNFDRQGFAEAELANREIAESYPYSKLIAIIISSDKEYDCMSTARELEKIINSPSFSTESAKIEIIGPAPAPIYFLERKYRYRLFLKSPRNYPLQYYTQELLKVAKLLKCKARITVDVDPQTFL